MINNIVQSPLYSGNNPTELDSLKSRLRLDSLKFGLSEGSVRIEFTKLDGTHRSMLCTKNFASIPELHVPKGTGTKKINESILHVFDLDKQAWRSIKIDNIQSWAIVY